MTPTALQSRKPPTAPAAGKHVVFAVILGTGLRWWGCGQWPCAQRFRTASLANGAQHLTVDAARGISRPPRAIAGGTAASKRGFPERAWKRIISAPPTLGLKGPEIIARSAAGEAAALAALDRFEGRLARGLAQVINLLDPDVIVLGGGASQIPRSVPKCSGPSERVRFRQGSRHAGSSGETWGCQRSSRRRLALAVVGGPGAASALGNIRRMQVIQYTAN